MNSLANIIRCIESYKITDPELLNALHKHIKQQNEIVNTFFIRYSDEMLIFFLQKQYTGDVGRHRGQSDVNIFHSIFQY